MASIKVAVRVRPFNQREKESSCIIEMNNKKTTIINPKQVTSIQGDVVREQKYDFSFDYSYWSHAVNDENFVSQEKVFKDLGHEVVDNAFEGYNACIFAYGQTGSGKTYTMMGTPDSVGLIPRICQALFDKMSAQKSKGTTYRTEVSYLEIYNERVKDLLKLKQDSHNLKVREHPKLGPYVQDLSKHLVMDFGDIQELMTKGNSHRTTASTNMNDVSSRSHAIFTICFSQATFSKEMPRETASKVNLVDLAGSERADASGATGQRLKEGGHINKSLVTLGTVISALADLSSASSARQKTIFIPYRDSVLTWLLKDSLGGNSKTMMIATISPADINYGESLSTLRYANRAKNIINKPTINEDSNVKLIRELRAEIAKLKALLGNNVNVDTPVSSGMMEKLQENEAKVKLLTEEWTEKWKETHKILQDKRFGLRKSLSAVGVVLDSEQPHLVGIEDDLLSTGITLYHLNEGTTTVGCENAATQRDIVLSGIGIEQEHCVIELINGVATLIPRGEALCYVNFISIDKPTRLSQGCVILIGRTNMFRYNDPAEVAKLRKKKNRTTMLSLSRLSLLDLSRSANDLAASKSLESLSSPSSILTESPAEIDETDCNNGSKMSSLTTSAPNLLDLSEEKESDSKSDEDEDVQSQITDLKESEAKFQQVAKRLDDNFKQLEDDSNVNLNEVLYNNAQQLEDHRRLNDFIEQEVQRRLLEHQISQDNNENFGNISPITPDSPLSEINDEFLIMVPSFSQRGSGRNTHYVYEIVIYTKDAKWTIYRRYQRFRDLYLQTWRKYGDKVKLPDFPPRFFFTINYDKKIEERRLKLQEYLQDLVSVCSSIEGIDLMTSGGITRQSLCKFSNFFERGFFEVSKYGTS